MAEMTDAQVALMAAVTAKRPDQYESDEQTQRRANSFLRWLNDAS